MSQTVRIAAIADIHVGTVPNPAFQSLLTQVTGAADVLVICGDLTHHGQPEEAELVARDLGRLRIPVLAVLGNHDCHSEQEGEVRRILKSAGIHVLDGEGAEVKGIGFAGVKGFATGFGRRVLEPWGEGLIKQFVREAVNEALKLESALASLSTPQRIALLHYAPVIDTVQGEPLEIYPFLGSSRLEEPLNRYAVTAAFHGHAHHGQPEGRTSQGIPVYNVSLPLLSAIRPGEPPFRLLEVEVAEAPPAIP
jgi:Icc-related predicted phosphoesterase